MTEAGLRLGHCRIKACAGSHCALCPYGLPYAFILSQTDLFSHPATRSRRSRSTSWTSLDTAHGRCPTAVCAQAGFQKRGGGAGLPSLSKRRANSPPPSTAQLPGYCPRPGRHLLWVISICMAIITAFGKKIPLSKKPCRVANAGTELEAATPPSSRLLPIMQELPVPPPLPWPQKSTAAPAGSFGQPGPPQPASCLREGALRKGWPCLCMLQGSQGIQSTR